MIPIMKITSQTLRRPRRTDHSRPPPRHRFHYQPRNAHRGTILLTRIWIQPEIIRVCVTVCHMNRSGKDETVYSYVRMM